MEFIDDGNNQIPRVRGWCFTLNNYTDDEYTSLLGAVCTYIIIGKEIAPTTLTPHLQGYIYFKEKKSTAGVRRLCTRAHWLSAKGDSNANFTYCSKEGNFAERGIIPVSQKRKGELEVERFQNAWVNAKSGNFDEIPCDIMIRFYRTIKEIRKDHMVRIPDLEQLSGVWICGLAGCGKSRRARVEYPEAYFKMCNKWWDGYQGESHVIIDDFGREHKVLGHHLKIWADRYAFLAETKGGAIMIRPKFIVVTTQYRIETIFDDQETADAIRRRFTVINMFEPIVFA